MSIHHLKHEMNVKVPSYRNLFFSRLFAKSLNLTFAPNPHADGTIFKEITPEGYVEGAFMFIRNGKYYFMWSEGGWTGPDYCVAYAVADSPMGPFKRIGKVLQQDPKIAAGAGHHSVLQLLGKDEWYIVYHCRPLTETDGNSLQVCIERMYFDGEGMIRTVVLSVEGKEGDGCPRIGG